MSYTEIYSFDAQGRSEFYDKINNSRRGAPAVWRTLESKYLPEFMFTTLGGDKEPASRVSLLDPAPLQEIWNMASDPRLSEGERICMLSTFDKVLLRKENFMRVVEAFRAFEGDTNLPEQADVIEHMFNDEGIVALGWNQTSINGSLWDSYNPDTEEHTPYDLEYGDKHFWLFEELNSPED